MIVDKGFKPKITLFHCANAISKMSAPFSWKKNNIEIKTIEMPCSSMVKDVFLLRAFEAGSDAVVVLVCPQDQCLHVEGSIRARKRVERVQQIMDEIGLDSSRLSIANITSGDEFTVGKIMQEVIEQVTDLGPIRAAA
jgi:coenzyme F420-reducing hydrogenase delta subunit